MKKSSLSIISLCLILWGISFGTSGCDSNQASATEETTTVDENEETENSTLIERNDTTQGMRSRGLDMSTARVAGFSFQTSFPYLYDIVKDDSYLLSDMENYAEKIMVPGQINTEKEFFDLLVERDSTIIPHLESPVINYLDNAYDSDEGAFNKVLAELKKLGMAINMAEGMVTGLSAGPVLPNKIREINSPNLNAFIAFQNANAESMSGEYPFANMEPYETMVLSGEVLMKNQPNPYFKLIEKRFYEALESLTDIHLVSEPSARQDGSGTPTVGGTNTSAYPYMAEIETLREFSKKHPESRYSEAIARLSENMSEISSKPENIYIIITEWVDELVQARRTVAKHLAEGEDIPHYLKIKRGDGKEYYAIAYRFYDDGDKAAAALEKIRKNVPNARMIFVSVKGDELYQLGPSN